MSKGAQIAGGATLIALLLGWYGVTNLAPGSTFTYYKSVGEFRSATSTGAHARVHGYVAANSIQRDLAAKQVRFAVQNDPLHGAAANAGTESVEPLEVVFGSLETPDLFKDGAQVVVEGRLLDSGDGRLFHADKVMAKCPSKFEGIEEPPIRAVLLD